MERLVAVTRASTKRASITRSGERSRWRLRLLPRGTTDIDLNLTADPAEPKRVLSALPETGSRSTAGAQAPSLRQPSPAVVASVALDTPIDLFLPASPMYHRLVVNVPDRRYFSASRSRC